MKVLSALLAATLLVSTAMSYQDAFADEQKNFGTKSQHDKSAQTMQSHDMFTGTEGWIFSLELPDDWTTITSIPYAFANTEIDGNHIVVDNVPIKQKFTSRDDFHSYLKDVEMNSAGFSLGNSMTTMNTDYGYKTTIELKLTKQDGNQILMRKDFHFVSQEGSMYLVQGFSSDSDSFKTLRYTMSTFKPVV